MGLQKGCPSVLPGMSTPTKRGATAGTVENRAEDPAQPQPERSRRSGRALERRPLRASAPTQPNGWPIQTPLGRTSARSGSVQQQCIRSEGGSRATLKTSLAPAASPDTLLYVRPNSHTQPPNDDRGFCAQLEG